MATLTAVQQKAIEVFESLEGFYTDERALKRGFDKVSSTTLTALSNKNKITYYYPAEIARLINTTFYDDIKARFGYKNENTDKFKVTGDDVAFALEKWHMPKEAYMLDSELYDIGFLMDILKEKIAKEFNEKAAQKETIVEKVKQASTGIAAYHTLREEFEEADGMGKIAVAHKIVDARSEETTKQRAIHKMHMAFRALGEDADIMQARDIVAKYSKAGKFNQRGMQL